MVHALSHTALPLNTLLLSDIVDVSLARLDREPQTTPMVFSFTPELVGFEGDAISVSQSMLDGRQGVELDVCMVGAALLAACWPHRLMRHPCVHALVELHPVRKKEKTST